MRGHPDSDIDPGCPPWHRQTPQADALSPSVIVDKILVAWENGSDCQGFIREYVSAIRQSERAKITDIIEERIGTYTRKYKTEGGSQETKAEQRFAIEVLERLKSQFQTSEGV